MKRPRGAVGVILLWASFNAVLSAVLIYFNSRIKALEMGSDWGAVGILLVTSAIFALPLRAATQPRGAARQGADSGAPALAFAGACLLGGMAWVLGAWLAYPAVPLLVFCARRLWTTRAGRQRGVGA
ncbi:hypothetical protein K6U06_01985 [Acidiferrimicrobium sp. IK]|uniref:hypothetical protein n=1 Tax=Acidiferrimicrobium sp. IK TaxID=2871700 RepID=UPI0021CB49AB|nr:hypothetical protein [Acidiferrimicrobium sp. IK]MCU4183114.1 hypothetical protein [Acidiferrimicrobium sp. IK]